MCRDIAGMFHGCHLDTVNPVHNEPFCSLANGSLYLEIRCKGRDSTWIRQGGAYREGSLYPGIRCVGGLLYPGFTVGQSKIL